MYGVKVSKPGFDVKTANSTDLVMSSDFPFLKIVAQGSVSIEVTADGVNDTTIEHGLGYTPVYIHYVSVDPANPSLRYPSRFAADGVFGAMGFDSYIDENELVMRWFDESIDGFTPYPYTVGFHYYIFWDELS